MFLSSQGHFHFDKESPAKKSNIISRWFQNSGWAAEAEQTKAIKPPLSIQFFFGWWLVYFLFPFYSFRERLESGTQSGKSKNKKAKQKSPIFGIFSGCLPTDFDLYFFLNAVLLAKTWGFRSQDRWISKVILLQLEKSHNSFESTSMPQHWQGVFPGLLHQVALLTEKGALFSL